MYSKADLNVLYRKIATNIDISDEMFDAAEKEYTDLGKWLDDETPDFKISIFPQGSFGLGTVIKPISNEDDYDLDIVCQFAKSYGLSAKQLKVDVVKPLLVRYKRSSKDIVNKRRCWHVDYDDIPQFHMDIIPSFLASSEKFIYITDHNEEADTYEYIGSNPSGYIKWFFDRCAKQREQLYQNYVKEHRLVVMQADIEKVKRRKIKTPLQRVVQLLKRHRDIMFAADDSGNKPVSIIITTMAATLYQEEDNIIDAMTNILAAAPKWIRDNMKDGKYFIENPSYEGENFADKWNTHPERAVVFFKWLKQAADDLTSETLFGFSRISLGNHVKQIFWEKTGKQVFSSIAEKERAEITSGRKKIDTTTGNISKAGSIVVPVTHHYGK